MSMFHHHRFDLGETVSRNVCLAHRPGRTPCSSREAIRTMNSEDSFLLSILSEHIPRKIRRIPDVLQAIGKCLGHDLLTVERQARSQDEVQDTRREQQCRPRDECTMGETYSRTLDRSQRSEVCKWMENDGRRRFDEQVTNRHGRDAGQGRPSSVGIDRSRCETRTGERERGGRRSMTMSSIQWCVVVEQIETDRRTVIIVAECLQRGSIGWHCGLFIHF